MLIVPYRFLLGGEVRLLTAEFNTFAAAVAYMRRRYVTGSAWCPAIVDTEHGVLFMPTGGVDWSGGGRKASEQDRRRACERACGAEPDAWAEWAVEQFYLGMEEAS